MCARRIANQAPHHGNAHTELDLRHCFSFIYTVVAKKLPRNLLLHPPAVINYKATSLRTLHSFFTHYHQQHHLHRHLPPPSPTYYPFVYFLLIITRHPTHRHSQNGDGKMNKQGRCIFYPIQKFIFYHQQWKDGLNQFTGFIIKPEQITKAMVLVQLFFFV